MDKVSIITTYYNTGIDIIKCLASIAKQKTTNDFIIEYIIYDDGSTDNTGQYVNNFFEKIGPIYNIGIIHIASKENLGRGLARREAINCATGDYYMFLDSDDYYIHDDFVERAYFTITKFNADICEYGLKYIDNNCNPHNMSVKEMLTLNSKGDGNLMFLFYEDHIAFMPWTKIVKKEIIKSKEYDGSREYDDIKTIPYWVYNANKIVIAPTIEILYHPSENSITGKNMGETRLGTVEAISSLFDDFKDHKGVLKAMYDRCLVDLKTILNLNSEDKYFRKMSELNTKMLSYIFPNKYKSMTCEVE